MPRNRTKPESDRVTVTLGPGQRGALERIAETNETTLAFVVRYALKRFIEDAERNQQRLQFPMPPRQK